MTKRSLLSAFLCFAGFLCQAQNKVLDAFKPMCDSLTVLTMEHFGNKGEVALQKVLKRNGRYDLYFTRGLSDWAWRENDRKWFLDKIDELYPREYRQVRPGAIYCRNIPFDDLILPKPGNNGRPGTYKFAPNKSERHSLITELGKTQWRRGLSGRNIALWQSHGRYYNEKEDRWMWQRAPIHRTIEDIYTQSYVLPFLVPMLENAGAYVLTPRERDISPYEVICDNDACFLRDTLRFDFGDLPLRTAGTYEEKGRWSNAGQGFADMKAVYSKGDNPFMAGTARTAGCTSSNRPSATAVWKARVAQRGKYAVYISYKSQENSSRNALYTVRHLAGVSRFTVDQTRGGGTWMYLGSFEFSPDEDAIVSLDNSTPAGYNYAKNSVVSADAVKIGGGIGKIARGLDSLDVSQYSCSGLPSYLEGAMYWMQWAGISYDAVINQWDGDYTRDYASRGAWVTEMKNNRGVPFDLSLAFHSDAGTSPDDSLVGTLAIYTLMAEGSRKYSDGRDRMGGRLLADCVQTQVVSDIRADFDPLWSRRDIRDRSYSESRTTDVPGIILELLSHQNFADMKYGHDPAFKFTACRAVYKGILKFLSSWYGVPYVVQPLPVRDFKAVFVSDGKLRLSWNENIDEKEPTAGADGYILYTRVGDGVFDSGTRIDGKSVEFSMERGKVYSWKVEAYNEGGRSFPSEILSAGIADSPKGKVLVVNNFTRLASPAWFDTPSYAGFDSQLDGGVSYVNDISLCGDNYELRRGKDWISDYAPGFGASDTEMAGSVIAGNNFDYPFVHGNALLAAGWSFCSSSASAFDGSEAVDAVDLICGKQVSTLRGSGLSPAPFQVFPSSVREALGKAAGEGRALLVSGSRIATDAWDSIYPFADTTMLADGCEFAEYQSLAKEFAEKTLGYVWTSSRSGSDGLLFEKKSMGRMSVKCSIHTVPNQDFYCVENCDALKTLSSTDKVLLRYSNKLPAAVLHHGDGYRSASFGFPLECIQDQDALRGLMEETMNLLTDK